MRYILTDRLIKEIDDLRYKYQTEKKVNLNEEPSRFGMPTLFGGTDVITRRNQINFLDKIVQCTSQQLKPQEDIKTAESYQGYFTSAKLLLSACLYVLDQIKGSKRNSALYRIIEDALGITKEHYLDDEDKLHCFMTARRILNDSSFFDKYNDLLKDQDADLFTEKEWDDFKSFVNKSCDNYESLQHTTSYPFTSVTDPAFTLAFQTVGLTLGCMASETFRTSTFINAPKGKLTACVVGGLVFAGNSPLSVSILAPVIVERMLSFFCTISFAQLLSMGMGFIGKGIGIGVGVPLDLAFKASKKATNLVGGLYFKEPNAPKLTGFNLQGGLMIQGAAIKIQPLQPLKIQTVQPDLRIDESGAILINGTNAEELIKGLELPKPMRLELTRQLEEVKSHLEPEPLDEVSELELNTH